MVDMNLKAKKRKCEKLLRSYYTLPLAIERMRVSAEIATTSSYVLREGASHAAPSSPVESIVLKNEEIRRKEKEYELLKKLRHILHADHHQIWELRYHPCHQYNDSQTMIIMQLDHNQYYKYKKQLIGYVADVFGLWEDNPDDRNE